MPESKFSLCLTALQESGVEFVLVGGLAAVLQGAPIQTYDVDIVYSRASQNVERLLPVLGDGLTYDDLLPHSERMSITESTRIRVLGLDRIIAIKEALGGEKDIAVLPVLRQTAREVKRRQSSKSR